MKGSNIKPMILKGNNGGNASAEEQEHALNAGIGTAACLRLEELLLAIFA